MASGWRRGLSLYQEMRPRAGEPLLAFDSVLSRKRKTRMKTPTHMLMGVAVAAVIPGKRFRKVSFVIGCGAPDFFIMCLFCCVAGWALVDPEFSATSVVTRFSQLYFESALCTAAHNLLHSPISLAVSTILVWVSFVGRFRDTALSFLSGAAFHSVVDIAVHYDDGPLLLWPFNWSLRFQSPVSHWDLAHYGGLVLAFEVIAFVLAVILVRFSNPWLVLGWVARFSDP